MAPSPIVAAPAAVAGHSGIGIDGLGGIPLRRVECRNLLERVGSRSAGSVLRRGTRGRRLDGYAGIAYIDSDAHLQTLAVSPNSQRAGLGRQLLSVVLAEAIRHGASRCLLEVKIDNLPRHRALHLRRFHRVGNTSRLLPGRRDGAGTSA